MACTWKQHKNTVLCTLNHNGQINFLLPEKILIYLINQTPKVFYFRFKIKNEIFEELVNLTGIKIPVKKSDKLKITLKTTNQGEQTNNYDKFFAIMRGESFKDRYLSPGGWQESEYFFPLKIFDENQQSNEIKPQKTVTDKQTNKQTSSSSALKQCPACGVVLSSDLDYCPYCKTYLGEADKAMFTI